MATPSREQILDAVAVQLAKIDGTGSYRNTLPGAVARELLPWEQVGTSQMPWVGFAPSGDESRPTYRPNNVIRVILPFTIVAHVNAASGAAKTQALAALEDDIIAAMHSTVGVGATSVHATWLGTRTDEDDSTSNDSRGGSGTLEMRWEVAYDRTTTHS